LLDVQSLAERAQAWTGLLWEAANAHAEAVAAREAKLQAEVTAVREIQRVKEAMERQARKDATDLKQKLEDAERKAKDATSDLQTVVEGTFSSLLWADSMCFLQGLGHDSSTLNHCKCSRDRGGPQEGASRDQEPVDAHQGEVHGDPTRLVSCLLFESWPTCHGRL
jgi:hypothetical protein